MVKVGRGEDGLMGMRDAHNGGCCGTGQRHLPTAASKTFSPTGSNLELLALTLTLQKTTDYEEEEERVGKETCKMTDRERYN